MYKVSGSSPVAIPVVLSLRYPMSPSKYAPYTFSPFNVVGAFVASVPVSGVPLAPPWCQSKIILLGRLIVNHVNGALCLLTELILCACVSNTGRQSFDVQRGIVLGSFNDVDRSVVSLEEPTGDTVGSDARRVC